MTRIRPPLFAAPLCAAFLLCAGAVLAQKPGKAPDKDPGQDKAAAALDKEKEAAKQQDMLYERIQDQLANELDLSVEQQKKVQAAIEKHRPQLEAARKEMEAVHEKMRKAMFAMKEGMRESLSMDQKERFDFLANQLLKRAMAGGMEQGMRGAKGGMRGGGVMRGGMGPEGMRGGGGGRGQGERRMIRREIRRGPGFEEETELEGEEGRMPPGGPEGPEPPMGPERD